MYAGAGAPPLRRAGDTRMDLRSFVDANGVHWEVWEVRPTISVDGVAAPGAHLKEEMAGGWLAFQAAGRRRRFYPLPDEWGSFSDAQLGLLCKHAVPVDPTR